MNLRDTIVSLSLDVEGCAKIINNNSYHIKLKILKLSIYFSQDKYNVAIKNYFHIEKHLLLVITIHFVRTLLMLMMSDLFFVKVFVF